MRPGAFVGPMLKDKRAHAVTRAVIEMARYVGASVIAEGVKTEEVAQVLRSLEYRFAQGWHYGKPMSVEDALAYLAIDREFAHRSGLRKPDNLKTAHDFDWISCSGGIRVAGLCPRLTLDCERRLAQRGWRI